MIKLNISRKELESFFDSLRQKYNLRTLTFEEFKEVFCNDEVCFNNVIPKFQKKYKKIYKGISSSNSIVYREIREYIISKFLENVYYCPYCGKSPLIHFDQDNRKKRMFQFDHFFPKDNYQKGIINFYNLIPTCNACNHIKSNNIPSGKLFHPHFGWIITNDNTIRTLGGEFDDYSFCKSDKNKKQFLFKDAQDHVEYFKLNIIYDKSMKDTDNVYKFIDDKRLKISDEKMKFPSKSINHLKDYFFENYYDKNNNLKHSNGKLKKDLIDNI